MDRLLQAVGHGGGWVGDFYKKWGRGGEGIYPECQRGIHTVGQYYPAHVAKSEKGEPKRAVCQRGGVERYEKRKQEMEKRSK